MRLFVTDCEGPISKNDNAMELTAEFVPSGDRLFAVLSTYDDYLAYVEHRPGYKAGDTLRLILPFLKAYGATDAAIEDYSHRHILLVPGADTTLRQIQTRMPAFMISTSYEPYIRALCTAIGFPPEAAYCTVLAIDRHPIPHSEQKHLRAVAEEISQMPLIAWTEDTQGLGGLAPSVKTAVERLNEIFWEELSEMAAGRLLDDVDPIGGEGKAAAVRDIMRREGAGLADIMYVGDSITDLQALTLVRTGLGLAISFNGNRYALEAAQVACVGSDTDIIDILSRLFAHGGTDFVLEYLRTHRLDMGKTAGLTDHEMTRATLDVVEELTDLNRSAWIEKSQAVRKQVRGIQIGSLG